METAFDRRSFLGATAAALARAIVPPRNPDEPSTSSYIIEECDADDVEDSSTSCCSHAFTGYESDCPHCQRHDRRAEKLNGR